MESFRASYCQGENVAAELHFEFDSKLSVHRLYKIVNQVNDSEKEIANNDELLKTGQIKGDNFLLPLDTKNLSFSINQEIKNRLRKDVGEINRERQYQLYQPQQGEIVKGNIKGLQEKNYYLVDLGQGTGHWAKSEWTLRDEPRLGQPFYLLIKEVREKSEQGVPQVILTRTDDLFLRKLLSQEIPQIKENVIVIRDILRLPGLMSKIIVEKGKAATERGWGIDPAGTCIGERGEKAKSISRLAHEQINFANWNEDKKKLLFDLLSPARPIKLIIKQEKEWEIVMPQQKTALLLQYEGKMLKKISEYLGVNIHVKILEDMEKDKVLENKGQISQKIGNYKNVDVRILEEIEK